MASRVARPNGRFWIQTRGADGKRHTIRLGVCTAAQAEEVRQRVQVLEGAARVGASLDPASLAWLARIPEVLHARLVAVGLASRRTVSRGPGDLEELLERFQHSVSVKPQTATQQEMVADNLRAFFGSSRPLREISPGDADDFQKWLLREGRKKSAEGIPRPLAAATVSRRCRTAKQFFAYAVRKGWIDVNPFGHLRSGLETNAEQEVYVSPDLVRRLIEESTSLEFRVILSLARFAGLRTPSEIASLTWDAVDWEGWLKVEASKTEHHAGQGRRETPLSGECLESLTALWETGGESSLLVPRHAEVTGAAWTDELNRLCRRVGVPLWPRPWNNMRASCETDCLRAGTDIFTTSAWLGHSPEVALRHYNRVAKERSAWRVAELPPRSGASVSAPPRSGGTKGGPKAKHSNRLDEPVKRRKQPPKQV